MTTCRNRFPASWGELHRPIPICSVCRKVRDDKESWMQVESYFKHSWDVDFTHGFCPDFLQIEMDKIACIKAGQGASATKG